LGRSYDKKRNLRDEAPARAFMGNANSRSSKNASGGTKMTTTETTTTKPTATEPPQLKYAKVSVSASQSNLQIAQHMYELMFRNVASDGFVFTDPINPSQFSAPGCIIASPSYEQNLVVVNQNYVYNWTRDAAIAAMELAAANIPPRPGEAPQPLIDYVNFANLCQNNAVNNGKPIGWSTYTIEGQPWQDRERQDDGPALQTLAILQAYSQLDASTQATAKTVIATNLNYLLGPSPSDSNIPVYQDQTTNLWEEQSGFSFFARAVQLRCFQQVASNTYGIPVPGTTAAAITWLQNALTSHWNGQYYVTLLPQRNAASGFPYDPNADIVLASTYGAVAYTDTKLLATAALLWSQWANKTSQWYFPINGVDLSGGRGPMVGRYPGDTYDGNTNEPVLGGHPWALCTCNFAALYYNLANAISESQSVPYDNFSAPFFSQIGIQQSSTAAQAVTALQNSGDMMLSAITFHSDHLELSEQFDATTGYERSVSDLTWSYAAFLSAVRAKTGSAVLG
jgi:glucoamylase